MDYDEDEAAEEASWAQTARDALEAMRAAGEEPVPWEQVKAALGLEEEA